MVSSICRCEQRAGDARAYGFVAGRAGEGAGGCRELLGAFAGVCVVRLVAGALGGCEELLVADALAGVCDALAGAASAMMGMALASSVANSCVVSAARA
jgi:hypothetical protein